MGMSGATGATSETTLPVGQPMEPTAVPNIPAFTSRLPQKLRPLRLPPLFLCANVYLAWCPTESARAHSHENAA
jgi:hypothetical protein